ncbi:metal-dependent hydrolase [bacterium]|nr:metal-dependent hydrolase [candidate division CSSED10-310 bacterium]
MSTPAAHVMAGLTYYLATEPVPAPRRDWQRLVFFSILSILPDLDFLPVFLLGFERANRLHHTYTHTLGFAVAAAIIIAPMWWRWRGGSLWRRAIDVFSLQALHLLVDSLTRDTRPPIGSMVFWPLSKTYVIAPVQVFMGVYKPNLAGVFSLYNVLSVMMDILVVSVPMVLILALRGGAWRGRLHGGRAG